MLAVAQKSCECEWDIISSCVKVDVIVDFCETQFWGLHDWNPQPGWERHQVCCLLLTDVLVALIQCLTPVFGGAGRDVSCIPSAFGTFLLTKTSKSLNLRWQSPQPPLQRCEPADIIPLRSWFSLHAEKILSGMQTVGRSGILSPEGRLRTMQTELSRYLIHATTFAMLWRDVLTRLFVSPSKRIKTILTHF